MRIPKLPFLSAPTSSHVFPISSSSNDYKISYTNLAKALIESFSGTTLSGRQQSIANALTYEHLALSLPAGLFEGTTTENISITRIGRIAILRFNFNGMPTFSDTDNHTLFTLTGNFKPDVGQQKLCVMQNGTPYILSISASSGEVSINVNGASATKTWFRDVIPINVIPNIT